MLIHTWLLRGIPKNPQKQLLVSGYEYSISPEVGPETTLPFSHILQMESRFVKIKFSSSSPTPFSDFSSLSSTCAWSRVYSIPFLPGQTKGLFNSAFLRPRPNRTKENTRHRLASLAFQWTATHVGNVSIDVLEHTPVSRPSAARLRPVFMATLKPMPWARLRSAAQPGRD